MSLTSSLFGGGGCIAGGSIGLYDCRMVGTCKPAHAAVNNFVDTYRWVKFWIEGSII